MVPVIIHYICAKHFSLERGTFRQVAPLLGTKFSTKFEDTTTCRSTVVLLVATGGTSELIHKTYAIIQFSFVFAVVEYVGYLY